MILCLPKQLKVSMYESFQVKNFRGFRDLHIANLGLVNLIAGKNNSGKTALMEALYLHSGDRSPQTLLRPIGPVRIEDIVLRSIRGSINAFDISSWSSLFSDFETDTEIEFRAEFNESPQPQLSSENPLAIRISHISPERDDFIEILREFNAEDDDEVHVLEFIADFESRPFRILLSEERTRSSRSKSQDLFKSDFIRTREPIDPKDDRDRFSDMKQARKASLLIDALRVLEPRLKDLEVLYERIHANVGISKSIPLTSMGDGMNRTASMILAMSKVPDGVIFVDEIENGLHHTVQKEVWKVVGKMASDQQIQVFATTHSLEMIKAAYEAFRGSVPYSFRLHRLDRHADSGEIEAITYDEADLDAVAAFDFDFEVRG